MRQGKVPSVVPHSSTEQAAGHTLVCAGRRLVLDRPLVMGVLNVTPDSFSDGGLYFDRDRALARARAMVEEGADLIDIGGESTRPGSPRVSLTEEMDRVLPLVEVLAPELPVPVSVDTCKPEVMREAARLGAGMINDVYALQLPGALEAAAETGLAVCLMHMQGTPETMQADPHYDDVVREVSDFLAARVAACEAAGIGREHVVVDPGFGFGKTVGHNLQLLRELGAIAGMGPPVMAGLSRKSMLGRILGNRPVEQRLHASVAAAVLAAWNGARILRVHDVAPTVDALRICAAVRTGHFAES